jgi:hypothetical protein
MNIKLGKMWNEVVVIYFKVPSHHTTDYGKENHEKPVKIIWDIQNINSNAYSVTGILQTCREQVNILVSFK